MPRKPLSPSSIKRLRASKPKVKTGCLTCKIRHVKCDESKPHCTRCLSTGRACDGYSPLPPSHTITHSPTRNSTLSPLPSALTPLLPGTPSEQHSFHTFSTCTTAHLAGLFTSPFWSRHVLQASLHEPSIYHAAVALGALNGGLGLDDEFAVRQYVKAIRCLTKPGCGRRVDVTLIAFFASQTGPGPVWDAAYPVTPYTPLPALRELVMRLDTQATQLLPSRRTRLRPVSAPCTDYTFTSLEEAKRAGDELWNYSLYTLQPSPPSFSSPSPSSCSYTPSDEDEDDGPPEQLHPPLSASRIHLVRLQAQYSAALHDFLTTHPAEKARERIAGEVLRLHDAVATLSLSPASLANSEEAWGAYTPQFAAILSLSKSILDVEDMLGSSDGGLKSKGRVGLDTGVLGPLYLVALRCRDPVVRREAVQLLGREGRREGLWDSTLLAGVAERVVGIADGCGLGRRVEDVDLLFDPEEGCRAGVRFLFEGDGGGLEAAR
ncbi:hypothetical protein VF21_00694 [Pseudogymnoascus sp. 05NY08]|nr:hypothetical protein VF21_00694 [Pseudogymnoascus sp. 05NY08]